MIGDRPSLASCAYCARWRIGQTGTGAMTGRLVVAALTLCLWASPVVSLDIDRDGLFVRIIDVGNGHAAVISMPGGFYMVYDTGFGNRTLDAVSAVVPEGEDIDLLVLSHTDRDHVGGADELLKAYRVRKIVRPGLSRNSRAWQDADAAIAAAAAVGAEVIDLAKTPLTPGQEIQFGETCVIFVSGFSQPPASWGLRTESETYNGGSIVVRLVFANRSILFTGDSVGLKPCERNSCNTPAKIFATELFMVKNASQVPIAADVLIAPHHGSKKSSSSEFIAAVSPHWVIIPAGRGHDHPHKEVGERYLAAGVDPDQILRTDRHDDEGDKEWDHSRIEGNHDCAGDDDVDITISPSGDMEVAYRFPNTDPLTSCKTL